MSINSFPPISSTLHHLRSTGPQMQALGYLCPSPTSENPRPVSRTPFLNTSFRFSVTSPDWVGLPAQMVNCRATVKGRSYICDSHAVTCQLRALGVYDHSKPLILACCTNAKCQVEAPRFPHEPCLISEPPNSKAIAEFNRQRLDLTSPIDVNNS